MSSCHVCRTGDEDGVAISERDVLGRLAVFKVAETDPDNVLILRP